MNEDQQICYSVFRSKPFHRAERRDDTFFIIAVRREETAAPAVSTTPGSKKNEQTKNSLTEQTTLMLLVCRQLECCVSPYEKQQIVTNMAEQKQVTRLALFTVAVSCIYSRWRNRNIYREKMKCCLIIMSIGPIVNTSNKEKKKGKSLWSFKDSS